MTRPPILTSHSDRRRRRGHGRPRWIVAVVGVVEILGSLALLGWRSTPAGAISDDGMTRIATIPLGAPEGRDVIVDAGARRVIVFCGGPGGNQGHGCQSNVAVQAFDADTFQKVAEASATGPLSSLANNSQAHGFAVDEQRHRLFQIGLGPDSVNNDDQIVVMDTRTLKVISTFNAGAAQRFGGVFYSPATHYLYTVEKGNSDDYSVHAIDPDSNPPGQMLWVEHLPQCAVDSYVPATALQMALGVTKDGKYLFTVCEPARGLHSSGSLTGVDVVRVTLPGAGGQPAPVGSPGSAAAPVYNGAVDLYPGLVSGGGNFFFDSIYIPGIDRLASVVSGGDGGAAVIIFDASSTSYVAGPTLFATGGNANVAFEPPALGIDRVTGRLFAHSYAYTKTDNHEVVGSNALALVEAGALRNAAAVLPTGDDSLSLRDTTLTHLMGYDPKGKNLWAIAFPINPKGTVQAGSTSLSPKLVVFHDGIPHQTDSARDVDQATENVAEAPGVTGANVTAQGSAYGMRYEMAPAGVEGELTHVQANGTTLTCDTQTFAGAFSSAIPVPPLPAQYHALCNAKSRVATFAHVNGVSLDGSEARAESIAADTNRDTADDLSNGTDFSRPGDFVDQVRGWNPQVAQLPVPPCVDSTGTDTCNVNSAQPYVDSVCSATGLPTASPVAGLPSLVQSPVQGACASPSQSPYSSYVSGQAPPFTPAACGDAGDTAQDPPSGHANEAAIEKLPFNVPANLPGYASAGCSFKGQMASATADNDQTSMSIPFFAQSAASDATVTHTDKDGSVVSAHAVASGINIANALYINKIVVSAKTWAHGRPGTNGTQYSCELKGVHLTLPGTDMTVGSVPCGGGDASKSPGAVQLLQLVAQFNHYFADELQIDFPGAYSDTKLAPLGEQGLVQVASPGGYLASIQASPLRRAQNTVLLNDASVEQPALVVTYIDDTQKRRSRLVSEFAGVALTSAYGIYDLPNDSFDNGGDFNPATGAFLPSTDAGAPPVVDNNPQPPAAAAQPPSGIIPAIARAVQAVINGIDVLWQHPGLIPPLLAVWALLGLPGYLLSRRRVLGLATGGVQ